MTHEYVPHGIPFLRSQDITPRGIRVADARFISEKFHERLAKSALAPGDVVIVRTGRPGNAAVVGWEFPVANCADLVIVRPGPKLDPHYLCAFVNSIARYQVTANIVGAVQQHFNVGAARRLEFQLPPSSEQRAIAEVFGTLDDKIESNERVATGLAATFAMAWGRSAASSTPRVALDDIAECVRVPGQPTDDYIGLDDMPQGSTVLDAWKIPDDAPKGASWAFARGDILFGKLRPYFKKVGVAPIAGRCSREILVVRPRDPDDYGLVLGTLTSDAFIDHCIAVSSGTRMPRSEWRDAARFEVAAVDGHVRHELAYEARRCYSLVAGLTLESRRLLAIRDALLPRLVSGRLRLPPT